MTMNEAAQAPDPQSVAEAVARSMYENDPASRSLGMRVEAVAPGYARLTMVVRSDMLNGFGICHGGFITLLADSAFAYACNSRNELTVAAGIAVEFFAPAHAGDRLVAEARELARRGRQGIYDVAVTNQAGETVAVMRGRSHTQNGKAVIAPKRWQQEGGDAR
ncbi:MAG: hydroxyphenylacetyl-CoA thioesterase PaaI [Sutterellaceae bacterium]|nr:hydroxyphenylacetyl-CoA thioesterase PaaI [Burkholderiaceae bacterium]MDW8429526.1 hydroxyphenylacetyl-CoA thioesterase PaaI [Sutterellaceae bacterium]